MFNQRLEASARLVEGRLAALLDDARAPERLGLAMRHAVLGGGKRFRPFLLLETAALFSVTEMEAIDAAAALELVHCYSLVHDDLPAMDNDEVRRGRPTVWKAFDEWTAILAGDALLTLAFEVMSGRGACADPATRAALVCGLAHASGRCGMVGGQQLDLEAEKLGRPATPTIEHVRRLQDMKTGALIAFAVDAGAVLGRADGNQRASLQRFGASLGFAFQIADDLLDATGDAATVGKAVAKDLAANKATLVKLMGLEAARQRLAEVEAEAVASLAPFGARAAVLVEAARFVARRDS